MNPLALVGARTLAVRPALELGIGWQDLSSARSLLLGERVYHLSDGRLQRWAWCWTAADLAWVPAASVLP